MSVRGLLIGAVILAALSGAVYWSERHPKEEAAKGVSDSPKLVTLKDDDVSRVEIKRRGDDPVLLQREKSGWTMTSPQTVRTDSDAVSSLLSSTSGLSWDRLVEEKAADLKTFGLADPAVQVILTGKDKKSQTVQIGDETPTSGGFYAKLSGDPRVFSISSTTKGNLDKSWKDLRDKRLLTFDQAKVSRVEVTSKAQTVEFGKSGQNEWQIVKPRPLRADSWGIEELVRKLHEAKMDTTVSDEDQKKSAGSFGSAAKVGQVAVTAPSGTETLDVRKQGEDYLAKSSVVEGVWKVSKELGEAISKNPEEYRNKKLFDFGFNDPSKIEIRDGSKTVSLSKSGEKWSANGKEMDPTSVQSLVDKLRDLSAIKLLDSGFTTPVLDLTVTSQGGKQTDKVSVSKNGNSWYAKRENEPTIYELDSKRVEELQRAASDVKPPPPPPKK